MLGYLKLKNNNEELYETDFLKVLKGKKTKLSEIQYMCCYIYYEFIAFIKNWLNIITIKKIYNAYIFIFPFNSKEIRKNKMKKCMIKVEKMLKKFKIQNLVISEELKENIELKNIVNKKIHVLDGRGLIPYLLKEIIEYILETQKLKMELEDLYICVKEMKLIYINNINYLAHYFRSINIITPNISKFQKIVERIEEKENTIITVTNNKKKSLRKSKLIINFDFAEEEIKKYNIYRNAIIISVQKDDEYDELKFAGLEIKKIGIETSNEIKELFKDYNLLDTVSLTTLYESIINEKNGFEKVKEKMKEDQIRIIKLYGKRGEIHEKEYIGLLE